MSIKRILVPLPSSADLAGEVDTALTAAQTLGAHVEALFISQPPPARDTVSVGSYYGGRMTAAVAPISHYAEERERLSRAAHDKFAEACAAHAIPMLTAGAQPGDTPAASWSEIEGSYADMAVQRAAAFDLMVAASASLVESLKDIAEKSLLQARRPVLLAPAQLQTKFADTAMIAWDESPECWHAVSAALPFLKIAKSVQVISVDKDPKRRAASQAEALVYLRCHGIQATAEVVAPHLRSVGETLLAVASDHDAGLLVMGAYSHSRLRELLLGGATRHVLQNATARPVFLMH